MSQVSPSYLQLLSASAEQLLAAEDIRRGAAELFDTLREALSLDAYLNYTLTQDGDLLLESSRGLDPAAELTGARLGLTGTVCGEVAATRSPRHATAIQASDDPTVGFLKSVGLNCYACTPMVASGRLLGTLGFGRRGADRFTDDELHLLHTVTHYLAMAYDRLRTASALRESERRLNAVLDNATVAIILMDERQHCAYMNAAAERLTGYRFEETLGRPLHDVIHHTHPDGTPFPLQDCPIDRAFPENSQEQGEEVFVHKDGHFYPVAFTASPMRDDDSRTIGTIIEVRDITEQKRTEQARELLMREVDHRARNVLAIVQSLVTLTKAPDLPAYRETLLGRVSSLARAQGSLAARNWEGAAVADVLAKELSAIAPSEAYRLEGPAHTLKPDQVQPLGMIIHELATNAAKYGALSRESGRVSLTWRSTPEGLAFEWRETGGPPVQPPTARGFGSRLIARLGQQLGTEVHMEWAVGGLYVEFHAPH
ncbi:PAS domain S-box protein [Phenylobacterium sp.]|uniref:PAS domain S-box protein n=1 Tax=Phenylobacterium sp. TaxID=1871053 RepID=UPI0025F34868|nr:PAS domain S-box protein [Phenylobacterium sp.]